MTAVLRGREADRAINVLRVRARVVPPTSELGADVLTTSRTQLAIAIARPLSVVAMYVWFTSQGWWLAAAALVPFVFLANVVVVHDLMHRSLSLGSRANGFLLGALAVLMLDSGHALQATHLAHHQRFPSDDDPEAYLASWPLWRVLLEGPRYRYRLWRWAWREHPEIRLRMAAEMGPHGVMLAALIFPAALPALTVYVAVGLVGSWLFPVVSVTGVHDARAPSVIGQSKTLRGHIVPRLMLGMGYHLEHHLWPNVPAHHLRVVAARADAVLRRSGARVTRVP